MVKIKNRNLAFTKMQALGNDFVLIKQTDLLSALKKVSAKLMTALARALCDRHFGVGADGLIVVSRTNKSGCALGWRFYNADGSSAAVCGNGLRCLALWAHERALVKLTDFSVATEIGPVDIQFKNKNQITICLGKPILESKKIPVSGSNKNFPVKVKLTVSGHTYTAVCVGFGNPHCVIFNPEISQDLFGNTAKQIQNSSFFPEGVNVEFAKVVNRKLANVFVVERGVGPTLACATGAAAVLVAGVLENKLDRSATIQLPGGNLKINWSLSDNNVKLTGPARECFSGQINLNHVLKAD